MANKANDLLIELLSGTAETTESLRRKQELFETSPQVTTQQLAKELDISERMVNELVNTGFIPKIARGRFNLYEALAGYVRYTKQLCMKKLMS